MVFTVSELASQHGVLDQPIHQWKRQFLENASLAFENAVPVKKYKEEVKQLDKYKAP